jgi:hypothetical protein
MAMDSGKSDRSLNGSSLNGSSLAYGLLRRREIVVPSLRGLCVAAVMLAAGAFAFFWGAQPFLSLTRPVGGDILVVEGWIPDYAMREALAVFRSRPYSLLVATGGPLPQGTAYASYGSHARLAAVTLEEFGLPADSIAVVPSPEVARDRTYQEGVSLREWLKGEGSAHHVKSVDVFSFSAHARRSRLLYAMALGREVNVGVYSSRDQGYDPGRWWKSSNGVRKVSDEVIAYAYAKLFFRE